MVSITSRTTYRTTWDDIVNSNCLSSGDIIPITLKTEEPVELQVALDESGKQFLVFRDCLKDKHSMNEEDTNRGGWSESGMRQYAQSVYEILPDDLQEVIVPTRIVQCLNGTRSVTEDKLFCLSYTQVCGGTGLRDLEPEDSQLDIFKQRRNRIKFNGYRSNQLSWWWLRSPYTGHTTSFRNVNYDGSVTNYNASGANGVCFGFCIYPQSKPKRGERQLYVDANSREVFEVLHLANT